MAVTITSVCNSALIKLGADRISSITQDTKSAQLLNAIFDQVRDELLRIHPWNFAIKRAELSPSVTAPSYGYEFAYDIPSDSLRILDTDQDEEFGDNEWKVEGRQILTHFDTLKIRYLSRIEDPNQWDPAFAEAFAWRLAYGISYGLTQSATVMQAMEAGYKRAISEARSIDGMEGTMTGFVADTWTNSRK